MSVVLCYPSLLCLLLGIKSRRQVLADPNNHPVRTKSAGLVNSISTLGLDLGVAAVDDI